MGLEFDGVNGIIKNSTSDGDVTIKGNDGGSEISLLAFDVSAEGVATFNSKVGIKDSAPDVLLHVNQGAEPPAEGMFILEANSASRQLRMQPPTNSDNGFIDYRGGNLTFLDDGTEVARFQGTTGFGIGTSTVNSKLEVAGNATITTADNTDTLTLTSTDGDASVGPNLRLYRNSSSPADGDQLAKIDFEGRNDNSQDVSYFDITSYTRDVSDGTEDGILLIHGIKAGSSVEYIRIDPHADHNGIVFNDGSTDMDFRVESNGNTHMLFVDGGNDKIGINTNSPARSLHLSSADNQLARFESTDAYGGIELCDNSSGTAKPLISALANDFIFYLGGGSHTEAFRVTSAGIHIGGTGAANALSDYEEGTYTPTVDDENGGSYGLSTNSDTLQYTKIGRLVTIQGMIAVTSESSPNGTLRLSLPFTAPSLTDDSDYVVASMALTNNGSTLAGETYLFVQPGSYAFLYNVGTDGGTNYIQHDEVDTNFQFHVNLSYVVS